MRPPLPLQRSSAAAFVARARNHYSWTLCGGPARICAARCASSKRGSGRPRAYEYIIDHAGAVHLDTNKARTLATAYRDPTFLDELYTGLRRRRGGKWASQCLGEYSLLRADTGDANADREIIVVFDKHDDDGLGYAGTLREVFDPSRLRWCTSGRLYHELTTASVSYTHLTLPTNREV